METKPVVQATTPEVTIQKTEMDYRISAAAGWGDHKNTKNKREPKDCKKRYRICWCAR